MASARLIVKNVFWKAFNLPIFCPGEGENGRQSIFTEELAGAWHWGSALPLSYWNLKILSWGRHYLTPLYRTGKEGSNKLSISSKITEWVKNGAKIGIHTCQIPNSTLSYSRLSPLVWDAKQVRENDEKYQIWNSNTWEDFNSHFPKMGIFSLSKFAFLSITCSLENTSAEQRQIKIAFYDYATLKQIFTNLSQ